jgi:3-hydroxyisobutyrate dehydrogenase-like beta-hydroxyacid dehydrogenase
MSPENAMHSAIGFVGLGMMGSAMAERLETSGFRLAVYSRTREHALPFVERGAKLCDTPGATAKAAPLVLSMISTSEVLESIALGTEGILGSLPEDGIHIDLSTVSPEITARLEELYAKRGVSFIHCPVLGSVPQAADGTLLLFAGGAEQPFRKAESVLKRLGSRIWRFEGAAQATYLKLLCNSFIAGTMTTLAQALVVARASGVQAETLLEVIGRSAFNSTMVQNKGASVLSRNFKPRFFAEHMLKDVTLLLDAAHQLGCHLPALEATRHLYEKAVASGLGKEDYSTLIKILENEAKLTSPPSR